MNIEIGALFKTLGWPVSLVVVLAAVLTVFGLTLDQVLAVAGSMVGLWALLSLAVNILKVAGVVDDGTSGKWSAIFNLLLLVRLHIFLEAILRLTLQSLMRRSRSLHSLVRWFLHT